MIIFIIFSTSSTSEYTKSIEKSHEQQLCNIADIDNQKIHLMETNEKLKLKGVFECGYMQPSTLQFFPWNWWKNNVKQINYYKNDVTFHGPQIYLSGPVYNIPYPSLMSSNFDSLDFQYPLQLLSCRLTSNDYKITKMTDHVLNILETDFSINHQNNNSNNNNNNGGNRFSSRHHHSRRHHHNHHSHHNNDDELQIEIEEMRIRFSVKGVFISKPYNESAFHSDGSFDINLHCHWSIDYIEQEAAYNVIILPSHPKNRKRCKELEVEQFIHPSINDQDDKHGKLRIYPEEIETENIESEKKEKEKKPIFSLMNDDNNNHNHNHNNSRKRSRSEMEISSHHNNNIVLADMDRLNIMPSAAPTKRRRLNDNQSIDNNNNNGNNGNNEEKQELEHKSADITPLQPKRFKNKSSNRKPHKTIHRHDGRVSVTMEKKKKASNHNNYDKKQASIDPNTKYRGYFIAVFVPRLSESYPNYCETMNLQPLIRGQIVFYDAIHADDGKGDNQGKPTRDNYQWLMSNICKTYKKKGRNLKEMWTMKEEIDKCRHNDDDIDDDDVDDEDDDESLIFDNNDNKSEEKENNDSLSPQAPDSSNETTTTSV